VSPKQPLIGADRAQTNTVLSLLVLRTFDARDKAELWHAATVHTVSIFCSTGLAELQSISPERTLKSVRSGEIQIA